MRTPDADAPMAAVRAQIDAVDDRILAAIQERARLVEQVRALKAARREEAAPQAALPPASGIQPRTPLRLAREAQILRRLSRLSLLSGSPMPFGGTAAIWHELIASSVAMQGGVTVSVYAPGEGPERERVWRAARTRFGVLTPLVGRASAGRMIQDLQGPEPAAGVAPGDLSPDSGGEVWWRACLDSSPLAPRILAALPFAPETGEGIDAWLLGVGPLEPSGDDVTLFGLRASAPISRAQIAARLGRVMEALGVEARLAALAPDALLIACEGAHVEPDSPVRKALAEGFDADPQDLVAAGLYARPLPPPGV
ncbi:chorismate mutase [Neomegalonema sp.]|uniref:chorismate mutase n=1 Tax=Neomegalonema sp. TaxID=2039713 RepID=UPI002612A2FE|nr:chorismate mutase [Neomegalonema sp.]MDD2867203.1 chorismate mutase [Neomegalonema sp.]